MRRCVTSRPDDAAPPQAAQVATRGAGGSGITDDLARTVAQLKVNPRTAGGIRCRGRQPCANARPRARRPRKAGGGNSHVRRRPGGGGRAWASQWRGRRHAGADAPAHAGTLPAGFRRLPRQPGRRPAQALGCGAVRADRRQARTAVQAGRWQAASRCRCASAPATAPTPRFPAASSRATRSSPASAPRE